MGKKIALALLAILVVIQFFGIDRNHPESDSSKDFITVENPPANVAAAIKGSCYDCHSNTTEYPWYARVAPVSWMIGMHVKEGREHLNFSEWGDYPIGRISYILENCYDEIEENGMPLPGYRMMHGKSVMNEESRSEVLSWMKERGAWED